MPSTERNVAIVGAGLIGRAWAAIFARAGWNVQLTDPHLPTLKTPPDLVPLVELCGAPWTSADAIARARQIYRQIGQVPVTITKEINGFVLNRLQGALLAEAFRLVGEGYISAEDLDHTVKDGLGLRWSFLGPFETIELNAPGGIPDYCARYTGFYKELASASAGPEVYQSPNIDRVIAAWPHPPTPERIAALTQRRNERLAALAAHKAAQSDKL